jgi:nucleoside-diphosphate-sugar epimerase
VVLSIAAPPPITATAPPHRESDPPDLLNIYGLTKRWANNIACCSIRFDLPCVVLRYFNVYGPRQPETGAYALRRAFQPPCRQPA